MVPRSTVAFEACDSCALGFKHSGFMSGPKGSGNYTGHPSVPPKRLKHVT